MTRTLVQVSLDWPNLIAGMLLGFIAGILASLLAAPIYAYSSKLSTRRKLRRQYGFLVGPYLNLRNGTELTPGSIRIDQNKDGSFKVVGRNADGSVDWESVVHMSLADENLGTGHYTHRSAGIKFGDQFVRYIPEKKVLHVRGVNRVASGEDEFFHIWKPIQKGMKTPEERP